MGYVLLVDNDPAVRRNVCEYFSDHNVPTSSVSDWNELKCSGDAPPSLIVMDQTNRSDGLDRLRSIRSKSDVPVIMTGRSPDEIDRVVGLELGADDYIGKPFSPRELLARVRAILRRRLMASPGQTSDSGECIFLPRFKPHAFIIRSRRLRLLTLFAPGGFEEALRGKGSPAQYLDLPTGELTYSTTDLNETAQRFAEYGIRFLAPDEIADQLALYPRLPKPLPPNAGKRR
jgi:CheY-like chemotaxis protein